VRHVLERKIYILSKNTIKFNRRKVNKLNICFNVTVLIEELNLSFADMSTYEIFEISNIYLIQVIYIVCNLYVCTYREKC